MDLAILSLQLQLFKVLTLSKKICLFHSHPNKLLIAQVTVVTMDVMVAGLQTLLSTLSTIISQLKHYTLILHLLVSVKAMEENTEFHPINHPIAVLD